MASCSKFSSVASLTKALLSKTRSKWLLYTYVGEAPGMDFALEEHGIAWAEADPDNVRALCAGDAVRLAQFMRFLALGYKGLLMHTESEWASCIWSSQPGGRPPVHMPRSVCRFGDFWIFGCHTREEFRGRGLYKMGLRLAIRQMINQQPSARVMIDTHEDNTASRRAILSVGFRPCGIVNTYSLWIPRVINKPITATWLAEEPHPAMADRTGKQ